jgi:MFS family permease
MGLVAPWAGALSDRHGPRGISLLGAVIMCAGCVAVSTVHAGVTLTGYILRIMPVGIGLGLFQSPNNSAVMGAVPAHRLGVASGLLSLSRNLGTASGLPLLSTLFMSQLIAVSQLPDAQVSAANSSSASVVQGVALTYQVAALIVLAAVSLAGTARWLDRKR